MRSALSPIAALLLAGAAASPAGARPEPPAVRRTVDLPRVAPFARFGMGPVFVLYRPPAFANGTLESRRAGAADLYATDRFALGIDLGYSIGPDWSQCGVGCAVAAFVASYDLGVGLEWRF